MAKEFDILEQASAIVEQAWIKWGVEQAIQAVASHPHIGQVEQGIYIGRQLASNRVDQIVGLTAVWEGAVRLAQDSTVRCVVLERNPIIRGFEDATRLTIDRTPEAGGRFTAVFRQGLEPEVYGVGGMGLVQRVIENITRRLV